MTRDWEIIRAILVRLEESATPNSVVRMKDFDGIEEQSVAYNMRLLQDADCIEANIHETSTGDNLIGAAIARRLTPKGHDLLDSIRNESVWNQIKEKFQSRGLDMSIDMVISVGKRIMESMLA
jgi:predicted transcriptional regulator